MNLDLDKEYVSIAVDDKSTCILCTHKNSFLETQHRVLLLKCSKRNLYDILHQAYEERMRPLRNQQRDVPCVTRQMIVRHFEEHAQTYNHGALNDARVIQQLMTSLEGRLKLKDGSLDTANVSLWKQLSNYRLQLLKRLSVHERVDTVVEKPYEFT